MKRAGSLLQQDAQGAISSTSARGEAPPNTKKSRLSQLANYLVETVHLPDEGILRAMANGENIPFQPCWGKPTETHVATVLKDIESKLSPGANIYKTVLNSLRARHLITESQQVQDYNRQFELPEVREEAIDGMEQGMMTSDEYKQPYYRCTFHRKLTIGIHETYLSGEDVAVQTEETSKSAMGGFIHKRNVRKDKYRGQWWHNSVYEYNPICRTICDFWQGVFEAVDEINASGKYIRADFWLVIEGKAQARQARDGGKVLSKILSENLKQELPKVVVAMGKLASLQFCSPEMRASLDLKMMMNDKNITIFTKEKCNVVTTVYLAMLFKVFNCIDGHKPQGRRVGPGPCNLEDAALKVVSVKQIIKSGLTLERVLRLISKKAYFQPWPTDVTKHPD